MIIYAYSEISSGNLRENLGKPQYSYYFVLEKFLPVLHRLGEVRIITSPDEADDGLDLLSGPPTDRILLSFTPPHLSPTHLKCPVICVFAWEFTTLPNETWDDEPRNDWRYVFDRHAGTIPLSTDTEKRVRDMMGDAFPVKAIPVPVFDTLKAQYTPRSPVKTGYVLDGLQASVIDTTRCLRDGNGTYLWDSLIAVPGASSIGRSIDMDFSGHDAQRLIGFYGAEPWGAWSCTDAPWIALPTPITEPCTLELECMGFRSNTHRSIEIHAGTDKKTIALKPELTRYRLKFNSETPIRSLRFQGIQPEPVGHPQDCRTPGIGLRSLTLSIEQRLHREGIPSAPDTLTLDGVIYTSVFNPADHRKNWKGIVSAFVHAFQHQTDATLILKVTHHSLATFAKDYLELLQQLPPFQCRLVALHGYLTDSQLARLMDATTYYVNASQCEGLCLPIMEFMSCGIPGIAPRNSAMLDYVGDATHFVVSCTPAPTIWPHDPRQQMRALHNRVHWDSLESQFRRSHHLAVHDSDSYRQMASRCHDTMRDFCSDRVIEQKMREMFGSCGL